MSTCCSTDGELDQLLGELIGIERIERVLVLQLRGQKGQEGVVVAGELLRSPEMLPPSLLRWNWSRRWR